MERAMSDSPCNDEALTAYAQGTLTTTRARAVEHHASRCARCGAKLVEEARLELSLYEVADAARERAQRQRAAPRLLRAAGVGVASLAVAAAAMLSLGAAPWTSSAPTIRAAHSEPASSAPAMMHATVSDGAACVDGQPDCASDASWQP